MTENESGQGAELSRREQFRRVRVLFSLWRKLRPFWGGMLLIVGSVLIGYLPLEFDQFLLFTTGSFSTKGVLFAIIILLCGLSALVFPELSSVIGGLGMILSTLSLFGALGGFIVGALLAGIGGLLCFAWKPPDSPGELVREHARRVGHDPDDFAFSWEEDDEQDE